MKRFADFFLFISVWLFMAPILAIPFLHIQLSCRFRKNIRPKMSQSTHCLIPEDRTPLFFNVNVPQLRSFSE
jgi:hypothetical protein